MLKEVPSPVTIITSSATELVAAVCFGSSREHTIITTQGRFYRCSSCKRQAHRCSHIQSLVQHIDGELDSVFEPFSMKPAHAMPHDQDDAFTAGFKPVSTQRIGLHDLQAPVRMRAKFSGEAC